MAQFSISQRMAWASKRSTTRIEDMAYSLLGIFDINMRNDSGQAHFTVKMPVRKEGGRSARLLILYGVPVVNI
jgi:hypothetical protein